MKFKIAIPQPITDMGTKYLTEKGYDVAVGDGRTDAETIKNLIKDADGILARTAPYPGEVLEAAQKLRVIGRFGVGLDNIDLDYCKENYIWVTIAPQANSNAVAEHAIGFILACAHQTVLMDRETKAGNWEARNIKKGRDVTGKTLGLIGLGRIGREVAKKALSGLSMRVSAYDPYVAQKDAPEGVTMAGTLEALLEQSDFVSIHMPSTKDTVNMVNKEFLSKMKPTAYLINCARGAAVDEEALYEALKNRVIAGAALDVMKEEPPCVDNTLFTLDNLIVSPHNAGLTIETMDAMGLHAAMGIDDVLSGRKPQWPFLTFGE